MGKFTVLSVGLHAEVRAVGMSSGAFNLGRHPILLPGGPKLEDGGRAAGEELAGRLPQSLDEEPRSVAFLVPEPIPDERRIACAQAMARAGHPVEAFVARVAIAREVAREMDGVALEHAWFLEVDREGFHLVQLEGEGRIDSGVRFDLLDQERRLAVANVFREEHRVDIKHVGGSPEHVDRWLEHLHRENKLQSERSVEWDVPDGSSLEVRTGPLRSALEGIHAGAILSIENACLKACTEEPGAIVISESVEAWFQIATTLRAALLGTQVHTLRSEEEVERIEEWLASQGTPGGDKIWVADAEFAKATKLRCESKRKKPQAEAKPEADPELASRAAERSPGTVAAAPVAAPKAAISPDSDKSPPRRPAPVARSTPTPPTRATRSAETSPFVVTALVLLLLGQAAMATWMYGRSDVSAAETGTAAVAPSSGLEELSGRLDRLRTSLEKERKNRSDLDSHIGRLEGTIAELQATLGETLTSEQLKPLWDEIDTLRPASSGGIDPEVLADLGSADRKIGSDLTAVTSRVDSLEGNIGDLLRDSRPDATALDALWEKSRENEEGVEEVRDSAATYSAEIETLQVSVLALHDAVDEVRTTSAGPPGLPANATARIDSVERTAAQAVSDGAELSDRLDQLAGSIALAREGVNRLESRLPLEGTNATKDSSTPDPELVARLDRVEQDVGTMLADRSEHVDLEPVWDAVRTNKADLASFRETLRASAGVAPSKNLDGATVHMDLSTRRFRAYNSDDGRVFRAGSDGEGHGSTKLYNKAGSRMVLMGSAAGGRAGFLGTYHENGAELFQVTSHGASGAAHVSLANARGEQRITMTTSSEDDGLLRISNREGKVIEFNGGGGDLAEAVRPAPGFEIAPGQVVRLVDVDADGPLVAPAENPYDAGVLGIVSEAGTLSPALTLNVTGLEAERKVALAGQVYCLVDATGGAVRKGDLLTSSSRPGHAQVADAKLAPPGTILGKALEDLESGTGLVRVWVTNR